ncbi:MAG: peptide chain release factor N(5)-glutamine methyltransferase, partial [Spirochaetaceae bacterium]|nr:peptide chain release factor N(5)-glutamine methyltransferase [Spirochaetaceae bacterium]
SSTATPELDSSLLLAHVLGCQKNELLLRAENKVSAEDTAAFAKLLFKRADGMPVAYLTGRKDFWKSTFEVSPAVLIPKPDTELLVELAAKLVEERAHAQPGTLNIADVCTGSGCIGISVFQVALDLHINPADMKFVLSDISKGALDIAQKNARSILGENAQNISFVQGDLLEPFLAGTKAPQHFDIILSNPPYVPSSVTDELLLDGRSEPRLALDGGKDGLDIIRRLIPEVWQALNKNGILLIETGEYNAAQTAALLKEAGFADVQTFDDLGGQPRVTQARKP